MSLKKTVLFFCLSLISLAAISQNKQTLSGYITDANSGEALIGANFYIPSLTSGTTSNIYGFYSLTIEQGVYQVIISYLGYETQFKQIDLANNLELTIQLAPQSTTIGEVVISESRIKAKENVERAVMGVIDISPKLIKEIPVLAGEKDLLKALQLLPGVQSGSEGTAGFYVRGGGPDQNLILLDDAVVYNPFHLAGFFSVFNVDAIKNVELIKGGYPAKYGGRLSSILNISMKEGDMKSFHGEGGIGLISSRLTFEGPIIKDKMSFLISGRRTYADKLAYLAAPKEVKDLIPQVFFYDLNAKLNYKFSDKDRLYVSGYLGQDRFQVKIPQDSLEFKIPWGNRTFTMRWNHVFNPKLFANTSLIYNDYNFDISFKQNSEITESKIELGINTGIVDYTAKIDFEYFPSLKHNINFGAQYNYHIFSPTTSSVLFDAAYYYDQPAVVESAPDIRYVHDVALYASDEWKIAPNFAANIGIRVPAFVYKETTYVGFEPRLTLNYQFSKNSSIKAGYTLMNQYIHLVTNSTLSFPWDVWLPSSDIIKPKKANQIAVGYFQNFLDDSYESSVEVYYKTMDNLIEYKEGADVFFSNEKIEDLLTYGRGWSYGAEFFLKKRTGRFNGWAGYTLSWSNRQFDALNAGKTFPAKYDRRHDLSLVANYEFNDKWTFTAVFVFGSGQSITLPVGRFFFPINNIPGEGAVSQNYSSLYNDRNGFKLNPYNRLDLGIKRTKKRGNFESIWRFDIYNTYSNRNPYFVYADNSYNDPFSQGRRFAAKQVSLLPVIPSASWNFKF